MRWVKEAASVFGKRLPWSNEFKRNQIKKKPHSTVPHSQNAKYRFLCASIFINWFPWIYSKSFVISLVLLCKIRLLLLSECLRACELENRKKMSNRIFYLFFSKCFNFVSSNWLIALKYAISKTKKTPTLQSNALHIDCQSDWWSTSVFLYHQRCLFCSSTLVTSDTDWSCS